MKRSVLVLVLSLAACATPESPEQAVFQAKAGYAVALAAAVAYVELPRCNVAKPPCSDAALVTQLRKADDVTNGALSAAEQAVRTPGFGESIVVSAVATARSALAAFVAITSTLGSK